jgi:hypothetical protein
VDYRLGAEVHLTDDYTEFDEGLHKDDPKLAQEELDATIAIMADDHPPISKESNPIRHVFQTTWKRLQKVRES